MSHIVAFRELQHLKQKQVSVRGSLENNATKMSYRKKREKTRQLYFEKLVQVLVLEPWT
jgi:hypothetical protein